MRFLNLIHKAINIFSVTRWRHALLVHKVAAGTEHVVVLRQLGELQSVVDIGANRGQFALAARQCMPAADIISFEPLPEPGAKYRLVFSGDDKAVLHEFAIGPIETTTDIHLSARDDSSSLLPISKNQSSLFPGTEETGTAVVRVAPLASFVGTAQIRHPALLKIDVQGYELQVLTGCEPLLNRFNWIYVECSFIELYSGQALANEVIEWLQKRGWALMGVHNLAIDHSGRAIQADLLFRQGPSVKR